MLVDDGSDDGTAEACRERLPFVRVVRGDGTLYWARAMALAEAAARTSRPDFLLWLNDDVELAPTALSTLLAATRQVGADAIIVGAVTDPESGEVVYSGLRRTSWRPKRFTLVAANDETEAADTFHGNVVLVPRSAYVALGAIDGGFAHAYADVDYGLRATRRGIRIYVSSPPIGTCRPNMDPGALSDTSRPLRDRLRTLAGPQGCATSFPDSLLTTPRGHRLAAFRLFAVREAHSPARLGAAPEFVVSRSARARLARANEAEVRVSRTALADRFTLAHCDPSCRCLCERRSSRRRRSTRFGSLSATRALSER